MEDPQLWLKFNKKKGGELEKVIGSKFPNLGRLAAAFQSSSPEPIDARFCHTI